MSRLRNRIRKADYFTDGELLRWHRDKRQTYSGLWAMAEDSGCLEDDPFEWKLTLWPSPLDADITVETLEQWRNELIDAGKLIPYEADGKRYLFIRTFHQHERPANPQQPDLPLPPWVRAEVSEGRAKDGKKWSRCSYVVSTDMIPQRCELCTDHDPQQTEVCTHEDGGQHVRVSRSPVLSCPVLYKEESDTKERVSLSSDADATDESACTELEVVEEERIEADDGFDAFWTIYPRREGSRKRARTTWRRLNGSKRELAFGVAKIMRALHDGGCGPPRRFIPLPTTFLAGEMWDGWAEGVPAAWDNGEYERRRSESEREEHLRRFAEEKGIPYDPP